MHNFNLPQNNFKTRFKHKLIRLALAAGLVIAVVFTINSMAVNSGNADPLPATLKAKLDVA